MPRPARPWFRFYVEAVGDRKLRRLTPAQRWLWVVMLSAARQSPTPGVLLVSEREAMTDDDLAHEAEMPLKDVRAALPIMERNGMIHRNGDAAWHVTKWDERQFESDNVSERTAKHRSKEPRRNVPTSSVGTPPETETETETENKPPLPPASSSAELVLVADSVSASPTSPALIVFDAWRESTGKQRAQFSADRRKRITDALKTYPVDDLVDAVRGWRHSRHHRGENEAHTVYNDLELLLRNARNIEKFRDLERGMGSEQASFTTPRSWDALNVLSGK